MADLMTPHVWAVVEIIVLNILLSGDNAVVIALACRNLPRNQRGLAIFYGVIGAVVLRILLTACAAQLLVLPYLGLASAALLLWIAITLVAQDDRGAGEHTIFASDRLSSAVKTVLIADLAMSFDNVVGVAAAARGSLPLLIVGLAVSIPLVGGGGQLLMKLMNCFPWLPLAGGGLLGYIAGELVTHDVAVKPWVDARMWELHRLVPLTGVAVVVAASAWLLRREDRITVDEALRLQRPVHPPHLPGATSRDSTATDEPGVDG